MANKSFGRTVFSVVSFSIALFTFHFWLWAYNLQRILCGENSKIDKCRKQFNKAINDNRIHLISLFKSCIGTMMPTLLSLPQQQIMNLWPRWMCMVIEKGKKLHRTLFHKTIHLHNKHRSFHICINVAVVDVVVVVVVVFNDLCELCCLLIPWKIY